MISAVVLAIGMTAAVQGVLFASQQNAMATKLTRMAAVGNQVRAGLQNMGLANVRAKLGGGSFSGGACKSPSFATGDATLQKKDDGLIAALPPTGVCVIDLDSYEQSITAAACKDDCLVPRYDWNNDGEIFRRMLVIVEPPAGDPNGATQAYIVVTGRAAGKKITHRQTFAFFDYGVSGNSAGLDL